MKRILALLLGVLCLAALYTGCSAGMKSNENGGGYDSAMQSSTAASSEIMEEMAGTEGTDNGSVAGIVDDRKIIVRVDYTLETKEFDTLTEKLQNEVKHANGYVERSSIDTSSTSRIKNAEFVFRIPVGELDGFAAFVESSANVLNKTQGGDDVTVQYFDTESRLQSLRIQQERVTAILEPATKISDILEIESELTRIRTEIEELTTTLRRLDNLTDYATVTVYISEVDVYEPAAGNTFGAKMQEALTSSLRFFWEAIQVICVAFVWILPFLIVAAVIVTVILRLRRGNRRKKARRLEQQMQAAQNASGAPNPPSTTA